MGTKGRKGNGRRTTEVTLSLSKGPTSNFWHWGGLCLLTENKHAKLEADR